MTNAIRRIEDFRDIESLNHYRRPSRRAPIRARAGRLRAMSRDNARTPMQWDTPPHAGFTTGTPWIAVNPNYREINVAAELADPDSVLHHYRRLIELRHTEPVVALGEFTMLLPDDVRVYAFLRRLDDVELLVLGNFSATAVDADVPEAAAWTHSELLVRNYPAEPASTGGRSRCGRGRRGSIAGSPDESRCRPRLSLAAGPPHSSPGDGPGNSASDEQRQGGLRPTLRRPR